MAIIGNFKAEKNGFTGIINTLILNCPVIFEPAKRKSSEKAPDFRVFATDTRAEFGAAWETISRETGAHYLSVKLDDPSFPAPIQCRLLKTGAEQGYSLLWDRKRS